MPDVAVLLDLISALPLPTLAIDKDERIVAANPAASDLIGKGATGRHFMTILRQPKLATAVEQILEDGSPRNAVFLATDIGTEKSYEVTLKRAGAFDVVIVSFQDSSSEAQAGEMRRDFVANVSHELRTPLTSLIGFIETLSGPARDDSNARERFLNIMADEAGRMNRLVGDLLSLSRVEAEERVKPESSVDLVAILQSSLRALKPLADDKGVTLFPVIGAAPIPLLGDADQLAQVFTNLIENAIKYGSSGKRVDITTEELDRDAMLRGPAILVTVRDHGPGIDPMHLPRLTERFYRADNHRSRSLGGTGLGLAIVKHILNRHRGRLKITSELGQGACFSVILPRQVETKSPAGSISGKPELS
ncbi:ATP-binding protein [Sulfitobacter sp. F26204]|uniref:ATP-binding protein n=1 Tax=Sulfitobacter sp. F26204 TaxID=2996014 RepID=UPI00225DDFDF|nr:ATP-binding protein [Sulfitobacter sp. F26204]MCX7559778.1 ATP-binding protein [Sulfitobacter sp. F26204]